jgi:serine-type D-Ala-D-Ala carboxypeptidase/endopeptidase (penicillin-binding protein 4)
MQKKLSSYLTECSCFSLFIFHFTFLILFTSCSLQKKLSALAHSNIINTPELQQSHIGISIYEPLTNRFWYNYNGAKYFIPASNTKLFSCYAAMKYLGDSLPAMRFKVVNNELLLIPTGDPTLLHPDFNKQPVIQFLQQQKNKIIITNQYWKEEALGRGWAWDDYNYSYMVERSALPVYGNCIKFIQTQFTGSASNDEKTVQTSVYTNPEINWKVSFDSDTSSFQVQRKRAENIFTISQGKEKHEEQTVPFVTNGMQSALELLKDTIGKKIEFAPGLVNSVNTSIIYSQPTDSLLQPMMYESDNFFAEQVLLMASHEVLGYMNSKAITDTLLKTHLKNIPQKPIWVDGSGLSRYNSFTPQSIVYLLQKMKEEFSWKRITTILPTVNKGTLSAYNKLDSNFIYAKTGTLRGQVALSGYLITRKNKTLIFSVMVNNHATSATNVRKAIELFLLQLRNSY